MHKRIERPQLNLSEEEAPEAFSVFTDFDALMLKLLPLAAE